MTAVIGKRMSSKRIAELRRLSTIAKKIPYSPLAKGHCSLKPEVSQEMLEYIAFMETKLKRIGCLECGGNELKHRVSCQYRD